MLRLLSEQKYSDEHDRAYHTYTILSNIGYAHTYGAKPEETLEMIVDAGMYSEARSFAKTNDLPEDPITSEEVEAKCRQFQKSCLWNTPHGRAGLWRQCQQVFLDRGCSAEVAGMFFLSKAENKDGDSADLNPRERAMLSTMALNWFSGTTLKQQPVRDEAFLRV